jgi:hypothetical protein
MGGYGLEVGEEFLPGALAGGTGSPEHGRGMHRGDDRLRQRRLHRLTPPLGDPELVAQKRLRRGGAEGDDHPRLDQSDLLLEPRVARPYLAGVWLLVQPPPG